MATNPRDDVRSDVPHDNLAGAPAAAVGMVHSIDASPSNTVVRNPAPDTAPPIAMPQIYGSFTLTR
jgi:hypothetical protein